MSANKLTDLLPIPDGSSRPHAYQVFGLEDGEQDPSRISAAMKATVARLKAAKSSTDAKVWGNAARLVQDARVTLTDQDKKAQLDARFGIIPLESIPDRDAEKNSTSERTTQRQVDDPLAGVLPSADPLAAVLPDSDPLAPAESADSSPAIVPPPTSTDSPNDAPGSSSPPSLIPPIPSAAGSEVVAAAPLDADYHSTGFVVQTDSDSGPTRPGHSRSRRRKKNSVLGFLMFATFTVGMLAVIGVLIYFLVYGPGQVAITNADGRITVSTQPPQADDTPQVRPPGPLSQRPPRTVDPIMGSLAAPPSKTTGQPSGLVSGIPEDSSPQGSLPGPDDDMTTETPATTGSPATIEMPETSETPKTTETPETQPAPETLTDAMIASADNALERVRTLIRDAQWQQMKPAAETVLETPMTDDQKAEAEALLELADLATYYRGGIERSVAELNVGNDFEVTSDFRVIIVERGEDLLVVRYNEKNRSFKFDEFPFSLAHKLASFSMPASPAAQAAKAAYQAIAPKATDEHREEAITWLDEIDEQIEAADPKRVAETIRSLFPGDD